MLNLEGVEGLVGVGAPCGHFTYSIVFSSFSSLSLSFVHNVSINLHVVVKRS